MTVATLNQQSNSLIAKVHLAESYPLLFASLKQLIENEPGLAVCGQSKTSHSLTQSWPDKPSCLLLDRDLLSTELHCFCKRLRKQYPNLHIIVVFSSLQGIRLRNIFNFGIQGLILKSAAGTDFLKAIHEVQEGRFYIHPLIQQQANSIQLFPKGNWEVPVQLSRREQEVLQLIVNEKTTSEIAQLLFIQPNTVETHRLSLLKKLGVRNVAGLVREALVRGLVE